jgi:imidazolonepropionase
VRADLVIRNARQLITCAGPAPFAGPRQRELQVIPNGTIASEAGLIVFAGPDAEWRHVAGPATGIVIDAAGRTVLPGFVDPHTHAVYAGDRRDEARRRLAGASYAAIAAEGGGILSTVAATRAASDDQLFEASRRRLDEMLRCGSTTIEIKSGYGLDLDTELRLLRLIRRLDLNHPLDIVPTFMGAHEVPPESRSARSAYVETIVERMIPAVAREGLAEWCDVFCEAGVFTPDEARTILLAGQRAGLRSRIHADELASSGGSRVAADVRARSADHLIFATSDDIQVLAGAGVVATLLPIAAFYLKLGRYGPARALIDAGVPVALATDLNPGGGFSPSMPFAMTLACFAMGMTLEEALVASTINAAYAVGREAAVGSLEPGKQMDVLVVRDDPMDLLRVGAEAIELVIKRGSVVVERPGDS